MLPFRMMKTDVLVIGAGLAGLRAAAAAAEQGRNVLVLSKGPRCSAGVIGFNAPVGGDDNPAVYDRDLQTSGKQLSDPALTRILAEGSAAQVRYLEERGLSFDRNPDGTYHLLQPLGCSKPRLVHQGTKTGALSEKLLLEALAEKNVPVCGNVNVLQLLSDREKVYGALGVENGRDLVCYAASAVVVAAGGCGSLYPVSTYPAGIQGDSYAMLARAGAEMVDMEFLQFEPCCLTQPDLLRGKGISTTLLHASARLLNADGKEFLSDYAMQKGELARAIFREVNRLNGRPALYDLTGISQRELEMHCLWTKELVAANLNPMEKPLPILPAAHTFLGGAKVDDCCQTSVFGLFAAGEAMGGLHGANRIGGCAGAETYVFGELAGRCAAQTVSAPADGNIASELIGEALSRYDAAKGMTPEETDALAAQLRQTVAEGLSLVRDADGIRKAACVADSIWQRTASVRCVHAHTAETVSGLANMALTAKMMAAASAWRKESRGAFYRSDAPQEKAEYRKNAVLRFEQGALVVKSIQHGRNEQ